MAPAPAFAAEPAITYDGSAQTITVDGAQDTTDLFVNFKDIMPGDVLEQDIELSFTGIEAPVRLYIKAGDAQLASTDGTWGPLSEYAELALKQMMLTASVPAADGTTVTQLDSDQPNYVFANEDPTLVASVSADATVTLHLELTVPTSIGNEMNDLANVKIPWQIIVQDENDGGTPGGDEPGPGPSTTDDLTASATNVAYEGGVGSSAHEMRVDNLPEPEWGIDWDEANVTVDGQTWDVDEQGLPFQWTYATNEDGHYDVVDYPALRGTYWLLAKPLEGNPTVVVDGKILTFPSAADDYVVDTAGPYNIAVWVRDVTDDTAADTLDAAFFKGVYGSEPASLVNTLANLLGGASSSDDQAIIELAAAGDSAIGGDFTHAGTHDADCDSTVAHAHVAAGTQFVKNGDVERLVEDGARIGLLWDNFIAGVLGEPDREGVLDSKAREAVGGDFAADSGKTVQNRFKYLDLVDMNDGNLWVATADKSSVTVFVPYFDTMSADDQIAVAYFDDLTRDYTIDMDAADLDAEIADTMAHSLKVTKTSDGILFDVPWCEFGPFELLWVEADSSGKPGTDEPGTDNPDDPGADNPDDDEPGADQPGSDHDGPGDDTTTDETDKSHTDALAQTGDNTVLLVGGVALLAIVVLAAGLILRRRQRQ
ncbi:LPXTG cell wall anchor domain-containing protein [Collinsella tanakaei]|uniref:LPXTG cell wall anchor domain-containing protein n=1 Tax=Collinsella tanakaei TaxID=626935 RepID=UPI0025A489CF|nr:LPXTG cell wall anchor domain-containing protein [Collinsella tanakaei]MDM8246180.1 LPXTG cell wall anchor domain-containing protein [Collinsella tanakaei]